MSETSWQFNFYGKQILTSMLADIELAEKSIEIEQFSLLDDRLGHRFFEQIERKLKSGVEVRIIADALSSSALTHSAYIKQLMGLGLQIIFFNPFKPWSIFRAFFRIHKKTLIIDSKIAWVGGLGIKQKFLKFRDTQVRLVGPIVDQIREEFEAVWHSTTPSANRSLQGEFQFLVNRGRFEEKQIYEWMRNAIQNAKRSIYITSSYFYPDRNFFQLIVNKAREGVNVKIILRGKDDEFFPVRFSASYFKTALEAGIEVYRYKPVIMHAKTMIVDDMATVGSCNLDKFSFYYNLEANIASTNQGFVEELKKQFFLDLKLSQHITKAQWQKRPFSERALEFLVWPIHNYL